MQKYLLTSDSYMKKTVSVRYTKLIRASSALHSSHSLVSKREREQERERDALIRRRILSKLNCVLFVGMNVFLLIKN